VPATLEPAWRDTLPLRGRGRGMGSGSFGVEGLTEGCDLVGVPRPEVVGGGEGDRAARSYGSSRGPVDTAAARNPGWLPPFI
jgi:hypothetical protein